MWGQRRTDNHRDEECDQPRPAACDVSQVSHVWTLVMRPEPRVNHSQIAICRGFVCRDITSRPPPCTCNNLTTFYGLNSRNYIIYAHFSFSSNIFLFQLLLKPTNLTFSSKLAVSRQIKIKCVDFKTPAVQLFIAFLKEADL